MPRATKKTPAARKQPKPAPADEIQVENRGKGNAIAAGRHALAAVFNINIRELKWQPVVIVLVVVAALLSAILWFVIPRPPESMSGQFNVAVAEFAVQDAAGKTVSSDDGKLLATYVQKQIETESTELQKTLPYEIWGPQQTGIVKGDTPEARSKAAAALASKIHANIVVYGVILANGSQSRFMPEFYVNYSAFRDASEVAGSHQLGSQLAVELPFGDSLQAITNPALVGRVNALDLITIGLAYYSIDKFEEAIPKFQEAADDTRWLDSSGKEVVYLLLGNAYELWASRDDDNQYLPKAELNYSKSLSLNEDYARGMLGLANVVYLQALGPLKDLKIDPAELDRAQGLTQQALDLPDQPETANVPAKAHFNFGQIDLARYRAQVPGKDWLSEAKKEFTFVTQAYEAGNPSLQSLAAHGYFRLGVIAYQQGDKDTSISLIKKAIGMASPFYQAEFSAFLGGMYAALGEKDLAQQSYESAITVAQTYGYIKASTHYQEELKGIK